MNLDCPSPRTSRTSWIQQSVFVSFPTRHNLLWAWWCCCLLHYDLGDGKIWQRCTSSSSLIIRVSDRKLTASLGADGEESGGMGSRRSRIKAGGVRGRTMQKVHVLHTTYYIWNMLKHVETCGSRTVQLKSFYLKLPVTASHCQSLPVHILQARCAKKASQYEDRIARLEAEIARRAGNLQCPGWLGSDMSCRNSKTWKGDKPDITRLKQASWIILDRSESSFAASSSFQCLEWVLETEYNTSTIFDQYDQYVEYCTMARNRFISIHIDSSLRFIALQGCCHSSSTLAVLVVSFHRSFTDLSPLTSLDIAWHRLTTHESNILVGCRLKRLRRRTDS